MRVDARLAAPAVAAWIAAGIVVQIASPWVPVALGAAAVFLLLPRRRILAIVAVGLAAAALVSTVAVARDVQRHPTVLERAVRENRHVELVVAITATGHPGDQHVSADAVSVGGVPVSSPVLVFAPVSARLAIGARVAVTGSVVRGDPGDDVAYLVFADDEARMLSPPGGVLAWGDDLRSRFARLAADLPGDGGDLLPGLAIGDTGGVTADLSADMKTSSLSHLTAVSGANCAVVVGLVLALGRALGLGRRSRLALAALALGGFVVLVTPEPSVLRAATMAAVVLLADARGARAQGVPALCVAVVVLLAIDPWLSRDYGFALSVAATAALLLLAPVLARRLERIVPRPLALVLSVPIAAQLACQPILVLLAPVVPLWGVAANMLAEPAAPVATVAGLVGCLLAPVAPPLAWLAAQIGWLPAAWIAAVARFTAALPGASVPWPGGMLGVALLTTITIGALVVVLAGAGRVRLIAAGAVVLLVVSLGAALAGAAIARHAGRPADWEFAGCDIGQGDAFFVRSSGRVALVDTGPDPKLLAACLDDLGIGRIDLLVLTHYDLDHVGGTDAVIGRVDRALVGPTSDPGDELLREELLAGGASVEQGVRGVDGTLGDLDWELVWPPPTGVEPGNAASLTMLVTPRACACLSALFLGDLGQESQSRLLGLGGLPRVDVVKVAHHGSRDQEPRLYAAVGAAVGLIGVGADNSYGHPTADLLDTLASVGTEALRTDREGLLLVAPPVGDGGIRVWTERTPSSPPAG